MRYPQENDKITVKGLTVSYSDQGPDGAPVIIFIHGFPLNRSMWDKQAEELKDNYRVITYDIRGHGKSDPGTDDFSIELFVNDLLRLMEKIGIEKSILCGLSLGGYIALSAVFKYPDRFDALILNDTQCIADTPEIKENRCKAITSIMKNGAEQYADEIIKNLFARESFTEKKNVIATVKEMIMSTPKQSLCNTLHALAERKDTCDQLPGINIPVLIMVGQEDKITPISAAQQMHKEIPHSALTIILHAGHVANLENPIDFNSQLVKFLELVRKKQFA